MKLSVSLPPTDVEFLDDFARSHGYGSRSAAVHQAVKALKDSQLGAAYAQAWSEWEASGEAEAWEATADDGGES